MPAYYPMNTLGSELVQYASTTTVGAANAVTTVGFGATVAYVSAGLYTVTFDVDWPYMLYCSVAWEGVAAAAIDPTLRHPVTSYSSTTGVLTLSFLDESTGAVHAGGLAEGEKFSVFCVFQALVGLGNS